MPDAQQTLGVPQIYLGCDNMSHGQLAAGGITIGAGSQPAWSHYMARQYYTLAVWPKPEGNQWSPQFGDYDRECVEQELLDTKSDWPRGTKFKIVRTATDTQTAINAAIDELNRKIMS